MLDRRRARICSFEMYIFRVERSHGISFSDNKVSKALIQVVLVVLGIIHLDLAILLTLQAKSVVESLQYEV